MLILWEEHHLSTKGNSVTQPQGGGCLLPKPLASIVGHVPLSHPCVLTPHESLGAAQEQEDACKESHHMASLALSPFRTQSSHSGKPPVNEPASGFPTINLLSISSLLLFLRYRVLGDSVSQSTPVHWTIGTMFYFIMKGIAVILKTLKRMLRMESGITQTNLNYWNLGNVIKVKETTWFVSLESQGRALVRGYQKM